MLNHMAGENAMTEVLALRKDYQQGTLDVVDVAHEPHHQLQHWLEQALAAQLYEPNAMTLATVDADGRPSARIVLIRGLSGDGIHFFTNYTSRKGQALAHQPRASLLFYWAELERQVRIEGYVRRLSAQQSDAYFASRPIGNRLGAWASPQSQVIASRNELLEREVAFAAQFANASDGPPRPPHWGGYQLVADAYEFWQGRPSRLHDRIHYQRERDTWRISRLAP
jgi:pyridoxamine 5'-phosphate oxidase